jgi:hypothetical protein
MGGIARTFHAGWRFRQRKTLLLEEFDAFRRFGMPLAVFDDTSCAGRVPQCASLASVALIGVPVSGLMPPRARLHPA